jgi:ferredoxin--NADP+ reductase
MNEYGKHFVAIIGGSVAGSEAARLLVDRGYRVAVFDQKMLPYGKIEDGLPKWHIGLRDKEEATIDQRMAHESVRFIPRFTLGKDGSIDDLLNVWGFTAVIIAIGAWHDREISVSGITKFYNKGVVKQNDYVYWFNHKHEPGYDGPQYSAINNTAIIGGGLASLDMVKITMIELVQEALEMKKGVKIDMFTLEKKGIAAILEQYNTNLEELDVEPCTLFYRRDAEDMPLYPRKKDTPEAFAQARRVAKKLLDNCLAKYMFKFEGRCVPKSIIEKDGKFAGMTFQKVNIKKGRLEERKGDVFSFATELLISSIGSLPKETPSLPTEHNSLKTHGKLDYLVEGFENVFAVGNVVTGRGNIHESRKHGREITDIIIEEHLEPAEHENQMTEKYSDMFRDIEGETKHIINNISTTINDSEISTEEQINFIYTKTEELQKRVNYDGNYLAWAEKYRPVRLEDMLKSNGR